LLNYPLSVPGLVRTWQAFRGRFMVSLSRNIETGTPAGGFRQGDSGRGTPAGGLRQGDSGRGTPAGGLRQGLFFLFSFGILGLLLFSAAMKALFVFSDPFWSDRVPLHWFVFALLIPLELFVCVVTMRALCLVRIRGTSVLLGTTVVSIFSFAQVWHFFSDIESCYCFGNAEIPYPIQFGTCLFLAMTGVYLLVHCPSIGLDSFVRLPIRWDLLFWIVVLFLSVVYFYRTDGGQVLAGFRSPSDLKFKLVDVQSAREKRTFVFEIRNEARKPITLVASGSSYL
jgi:hypothetical protein